jgi:hypothetical protein
MSHIRFSRTIAVVAFVASVMLILPASAAAQRGRFGVGVGFYGGYYGGPFGWGPYYAPYGPYGYYGGRPLGEVKIKSPNSDAQIYINGSLAGRAHDLKRFYLVPGTYNIEQRIGSDVQKQRIYVLANRSLKLEFGKPGTPSPQPQPAPGAKVPPPPPASAPAPAPEAQQS